MSITQRSEKARLFVESVLGEKLEGDFFESMKDGVVIRKLSELLGPNKGGVKKPVGSNATGKNTSSRSFFFVSESVTKFNQTCKTLNIDDTILFSASNLEDRRGFEKVVDCLNFVATKLGQSVPVPAPASSPRPVVTIQSVAPKQVAPKQVAPKQVAPAPQVVTPQSKPVQPVIQPVAPKQVAPAPAPAPAQPTVSVTPKELPSQSKEFKELEQNLQNEANLRKSTETKLREVQDKLQKEESERRQLEAKLRNEISKNSSLEATVQQLNSSNNKSGDAQLTSLQAQLQKEIEQKKSLEAKLQEFQTRESKLQQEKTEQQSKLNSRVSELESETRSLNGKLQTLTREKDSLAEELKSARSLSASAKPASIAAMQKSNPQATSSSGLLNQSRLRSEAEKYLQNLQKELQKLSTTLDRTNTQKKEVEEDLKTLEKSKSTLEAKANNNSTVDTTADTLESVIKSRKAVDDQIEIEERERSKLEAELRSLVRSTEPVRKQGSKTNLKPGTSFEIIRWDELEVGKQIGTGAFAEVFEANRAGERVAVKRFNNQSANEEGRKELETEVATMTQLHSKYVVSMYGACFDSPNMCIVMEFLARGSLFYILSDSTIKLPWERRWQIARDAALGMAYLHSKNPPLLHKDFKSGNLLLSANWRTKICDFGSSDTNTASIEGGGAGTVRWTGPEVINGEPYTTASDVYSFGIVLWELATRKIPFEAETNYELPKMVANGKRPSVPDDCPRNFRKLMEWCWDQKPSNRPSFVDIVNYFEQQGYGDDVEIEQDDAISKLETLEIKLDGLQAQKDKAERQCDMLEKKADREKDARTIGERAIEDVDRQISKEREKLGSAERQLQTEERKLSLAKEQTSDQLTKKKKAEKKSEKKQKMQLDELKDEKESAERKAEAESRKTAPLKRQIEENESLLEQEKARRIEVERQRDDAMRNVSYSTPDRSRSPKRP